jgi:HSP20 family protein
MPGPGFEEMFRLWDELNRTGAGPRARAVPREDGAWTPHVDIHEREDSLLFLLDLPGVKKENIELHVDANGIVLQGVRARQHGVRDLRLERPVGRFRRAFRLGVPIDPNGARASYRDGVLTITVPKTHSPERTKVTVIVE